jgi:hypothetical protein
MSQSMVGTPTDLRSPRRRLASDTPSWRRPAAVTVDSSFRSRELVPAAAGVVVSRPSTPASRVKGRFAGAPAVLALAIAVRLWPGGPELRLRKGSL